MNDPLEVPPEQIRGYVAGKATATLELIEIILQHLLAGNSREELQHDIAALQRQLTAHASSMREEVNRNRPDISPGAKAAGSYLNGRIDGVFDVITSINDTVRNAVMDRTRGGG